jgi:hypothetical protein
MAHNQRLEEPNLGTRAYGSQPVREDRKIRIGTAQTPLAEVGSRSETGWSRPSQIMGVGASDLQQVRWVQSRRSSQRKGKPRAATTGPVKLAASR